MSGSISDVPGTEKVIFSRGNRTAAAPSVSIYKTGRRSCAVSAQKIDIRQMFCLKGRCLTRGNAKKAESSIPKTTTSQRRFLISQSHTIPEGFTVPLSHIWACYPGSGMAGKWGPSGRVWGTGHHPAGNS